MSVCGRLMAGLATLGISGVAAALPATAAETRNFVVSMFAPASYNVEGDCSKGINIPVGEQYMRELLAVGYTKEALDKLAEGQDTTMFGGFNSQWGRAVVWRAKINGKPVNVWVNPAATPDPNLNTLDGKGPDQPNAFEDPLTHEKGVDNQYFRATGCFTVFRGDEKITPGAYLSAWSILQGGMPAWLISLSGEDLSKDGDVTVTFDMAVEHVERDAQSEVLRDMTFRINSDPRNHHEFAAQMKDNIISFKEPGDLVAIFGEEMAYPTLLLRQARLRLQIKPDGTLRGVVGGYQPWKDALSAGNQANMGSDWVGVYYNLRKSADANPDPKTGENQDISTAFFIDAVPAFSVAPAKSKKITGR